jgi:hypothetical protein
MARKRRLRRGSNDDWSMWLLNEDDLEDAQEMLWRGGYQPQPWVRYDCEFWPKERWVLHVSPKELKEIETEKLAYLARLERERWERWQVKAERREEVEQRWRGDLLARFAKPAGTHRFVCQRCRRTFFSPIDDAEVAAEFLATFGVPQPADCLAVCEPCFDVLMATRT